MENQEFFDSILGDRIQVNEVPTVQAEDVAIGICVNRLPNRDALQQLHNILQENEEESQLQTVYLDIHEQAMYQIGQTQLTIQKYTQITQALALFNPSICYVLDGQRGNPIPKETLVSTLKLKGTSIYDYI